MVPVAASLGLYRRCPVIGTTTNAQYSTASDASTFDITHNSSSGNIVLLFAHRLSGSVSQNHTATWDNGGNDQATMKIRAYRGLSGTGRTCCGVAWIKGGVTGSKTLRLGNASGTMRDINTWTFDLDVMPPNQQLGASWVLSTNPASTNNASGTVAPVSPYSLLVGAVWAADGSVDPFTLTGLTEIDERQTGTAGTSVVGVFGSSPGPRAINLVTVTGTGAGSTDDWSVVVAEFLPAYW